MYTWLQVRNVRLNEIVLQCCATKTNRFDYLEIDYIVCGNIGASMDKMQTLLRLKFMYAGVNLSKKYVKDLCYYTC